MDRFYCRRASLRETRAGVRLSLDLYSLSWTGGPEVELRAGSLLLSGRPAPPGDPGRGLFWDGTSHSLAVSEEEELALEARLDPLRPLAGPPEFWTSLREAGLCVDDPLGEDRWSRRARLRFRGAIGRSALTIGLGGRPFFSLPLEVFGEKLSPREELPWLLAELARVATSLALRGRGPSSFGLVLGPGDPSPLERLVIVAALLSPAWMPRALARIARAPARGVRVESLSLHTHALSRVRQDDLVLALSRGAPPHPTRRVLTRPVLAARRASTYDTPENRLAVDAVRRCQREARWLATHLRDPELGPTARELARRARRLRLPEVLADIPAPSATQRAHPPLAARRHPGYRAAWIAGRLLGRGLQPGAPAPLAAPGQLAAYLYERWCLVVLVRAVSRLFGTRPDLALILGEGGVLRPRAGVWFSLGPGARLGYQMSFGAGARSYSVALRPDFSLELGGARLVLDAKYRLDSQAQQPRHEDLLLAHAYKDALSLDGSFLLYPGRGSPQLFSPSAGPLPAVGAFPLRPGPRGLASGEDDLARFLSSLLATPRAPSLRAAETQTPYGIF